MLRSLLVCVVTLLALAGSAQAATLSEEGSVLWFDGNGTPDTVSFDPGTTGWTLDAATTVTVTASADPYCGPSGQTIVCQAAPLGQPTLTGVGARGHGGNDSIVLSLPAAGELNAKLSAKGGTGDDTIIGGAQNDLLEGEGDHDTLSGRGGDDTLWGSTGQDALTGSDGDDKLWGGPSNDSLSAGAGDDVVGPGTGNDGLVDGGTNFITGDRVDYSDEDRLASVKVDLSTVSGDDGDVGEDAVGFEDVDGTKFADVLTGSAGANGINGLGGADQLSGHGSADGLIGGAGDDVVSGGAGDDWLEGGGDADTLDAGTGNDWLKGGDGADVLLADPGSDDMDGGDAFDTVSYALRTEPVTVGLGGEQSDDGGVSDDIDGPGAQTARDELSTVEKVIGGSAADTLSASLSVPGTLEGGGGPDVLNGGPYADVLQGGAGADTLTGGGGKDAFDAGADGDDVRAKDNVAETVACGDGADEVEADDADARSGCETDPVADAKAAAEAAAKAAEAQRAAEEAAAAEARRQAQEAYEADMRRSQAEELARREAARIRSLGGTPTPASPRAPALISRLDLDRVRLRGYLTRGVAGSLSCSTACGHIVAEVHTAGGRLAGRKVRTTGSSSTRFAVPLRRATKRRLRGRRTNLVLTVTVTTPDGRTGRQQLTFAING